MRFGKPLLFENSGEYNLTRGVPMHLNLSIDFNPNGVPRYMDRWNHPRCITMPTSSLHYGSNNGTQRLLLNNTEKFTLEKLGGAEEYNNTYFKKVVACEKYGLEQFSGVHNVEYYICKYCCTCGESSENWEITCTSIINEYYSRSGDADKIVLSLIEKHMNKLLDGVSIT